MASVILLFVNCIVEAKESDNRHKVIGYLFQEQLVNHLKTSPIFLFSRGIHGSKREKFIDIPTHVCYTQKKTFKEDSP